jgi:hypothetical protein
MQLTHSLKAAWFQHSNLPSDSRISWFQSLRFEFNLYRYTKAAGKASSAANGGGGGEGGGSRRGSAGSDGARRGSAGSGSDGGDHNNKLAAVAAAVSSGGGALKERDACTALRRVAEAGGLHKLNPV